MSSLLKRIVLALVLVALHGSEVLAATPLSPAAMAVGQAGQNIYIANHTANQIQVFTTQNQQVSTFVNLMDSPSSVAMAGNGQTLYVTTGLESGRLAAINTSTANELWTSEPIHSPVSPVVSSENQTVYVCSRFSNQVLEINASNGQILKQVKVDREPVAMALTSDDTTLVVANHLPTGAANSGNVAAKVSLIDTATMEVSASLSLPDGSTGLRGVCVSPANDFAYVTHVVGRYHLPTTQLDRGWIMTNAISIIDLGNNQYLNTVLLDDVYQGAPNPWAIACTTDGAYLCVTHAGAGEMSIIDRTKLHERLSGAPVYGGFSSSAGQVPYDLGFLSGLRNRVRLGVEGPRSMVIVNNTAYVTGYFSDSICSLDVTKSYPVITTTDLGPEVSPDLARQGEILFNDATASLQQWISCASCHPGGRSDSLNWDLGNDGYGSPRQAKSLLKAHSTGPAMITGIRADAETAVRAGFKYIQFVVRPESDAQAVDAYLKSMEPVPSPYMQDGQLSDSAQRGEALFQARCGSCHSGNYYADGNKYNVGTGRGDGESLDTPTLVEIWRTAPYLQNGKAATMEEVLTTHNTNDQHGQTSDLSASQVTDLANFVNSIGPLSSVNTP